MRTRGFDVSSARMGILVSVAALLAACAYGIDPDRSGLEPGAGGGGPGGAGGGGPGGASSSSSSSASSSSASSSSSSSTSSSASSSSASSSSSSSSSSSASSSGAGGAPPTGLYVRYKASDTNATNAEIKPHFNVVNGSDASVSLSELTIRYYYTLEPNGSQTEVFHCDYAFVGCGKVSGAFMTTSGANADHYLQVSFSGADMLAPGQQSGEVQARYNKSDYASYDETNDYSFDPTKTSFTEWDRVTLYHNGTLVWGVEP